MRVVFLNAFPMSIVNDAAQIYGSKYITVQFERIDFDDLAERIGRVIEGCNKIECYIKHPSTIAALNKLLSPLGIQLTPSTGMYRYNDGDIIIVVVPRAPVRGAELEVSPEDLLVYEVIVAPGTWL